MQRAKKHVINITLVVTKGYELMVSVSAVGARRAYPPSVLFHRHKGDITAIPVNRKVYSAARNMLSGRKNLRLIEDAVFHTDNFRRYILQLPAGHSHSALGQISVEFFRDPVAGNRMAMGFENIDGSSNKFMSAVKHSDLRVLRKVFGEEVGKDIQKFFDMSESIIDRCFNVARTIRDALTSSPGINI